MTTADDDLTLITGLSIFFSTVITVIGFITIECYFLWEGLFGEWELWQGIIAMAGGLLLAVPSYFIIFVGLFLSLFCLVLIYHFICYLLFEAGR